MSSERKLVWLAGFVGAFLIALLGTAIYLSQTIGAPQGHANALRGRPNMLDRLVLFDSDHAFVQGTLDCVAVNHETPAHVVLDDRRPKSYPRVGFWTSAETKTNFPFTELLPSWNASTPAQTGLRLQVRTQDAATNAWSPWLSIGRWGRTMDATKEDGFTNQFAGGRVNVDTLMLDQPADAFQVRVELQSFDLNAAVNPIVRRIAVSYSGQAGSDDEYNQKREAVAVGNEWARDLQVPYRAQGDSPRALSSQICSPTSTTMVMAYCGVDRPLLENAMAIYDDQADMFGNWGRAVARAGEMGLDAWLTRVRDWDAAKSYISAGQPLIIAIRFKPGEFPSSVLKSSAGHLIVIRGFKPNGDVICNDPGNRAKGNDVVYKADELATAWFKNSGGVAYVIRRPNSVGGESVTMK